MKLQTRLTIAFLILSLISMGVVAAVSFGRGRRQILNDTFRRLEVTNYLTAEEFDRWLENGERTLEAIAQRPLVVDLSQQIQSGSNNQSELVDNLLRVHFNPRLQEAEFETLFLLHPATGEILASTDRADIGKFREDHHYFQSGREQTTVQTIYYSVTEQRPRLTLATPIRDDDEQLAGVLAGHLNLSEMARIFSAPLPDRVSEENYLVNSRGLAISELLYRDDAILQTWIQTEGASQCLMGADVQGIFSDYRGVSVLGVYNWLPDYELCLVTEIDQAEAIKPVLDYRASVVGSGLLLALIVAVAGYFFTGRLAEPVKRMRDVAVQFRQGELSARMELPVTEEYRQLAVEFNRMAAELQQDLEALEQRYESLFESVPVGLYQSSRQGQLLEVNEALVDILDYESQEELLSTPAPLIYLKSSDRDHWLKQLDEQAVVRDFEVQVKRKDGETIWLRHDAHLAQTQNGEEVIEGAVTDITDRYEIAERLKASEARFRSVVQNSKDIITILNKDGNYTYVSPSMESVLGYAPADLLGENAFKWVHLDDLEEVQSSFNQLLGSQGKTIKTEFRFLHADGEWRHLEALGANHLSDPDLHGVVVNSRDITARVEVEKQLQEFTVELERSNEELEQFAYVASHDLQEPLRMVASYMQLLETRYSDQLEGEALEFIDYAVDGAQRMQQLISDLLKFSRVGTRGKDPEPVDSQELVREVIRSLTPRMEDCDGQVIIEGELPLVMADPGQLGQVFQNLISNGLKFYADEPPVVSVSASKNGSKWRFAVQDNGIGIDPKYRERLFVIFQRLHSRQEYEGTGLGLAITKKIIDRHGGEIWLESEPGHGTTFYFTLKEVPAKEGEYDGTESD